MSTTHVDGDHPLPIDGSLAFTFPPQAEQDTLPHIQSRKILIPPHRISPVKAAWPQIISPLCEQLSLQVRMKNSRVVELRTSRFTKNPDALQKGEEFVQAVALGFEVADAIALLRLDDMYMEIFEIRDVRTLQGGSLARAISRIAGIGGRMKHSIENATTTRVVLAGQKIHILGRYKDIALARRSIVNLIIGSPLGKVDQHLRTVATRKKQRF